jgi:hypothetical protein
MILLRHHGTVFRLKLLNVAQGVGVHQRTIRSRGHHAALHCVWNLRSASHELQALRLPEGHVDVEVKQVGRMHGSVSVAGRRRVRIVRVLLMELLLMLRVLLKKLRIGLAGLIESCEIDIDVAEIEETIQILIANLCGHVVWLRWVLPVARQRPKDLEESKRGSRVEEGSKMVLEARTAAGARPRKAEKTSKHGTSGDFWQLFKSSSEVAKQVL